MPQWLLRTKTANYFFLRFSNCSSVFFRNISRDTHLRKFIDWVRSSCNGQTLLMKKCSFFVQINQKQQVIRPLWFSINHLIFEFWNRNHRKSIFLSKIIVFFRFSANRMFESNVQIDHDLPLFKPCKFAFHLNRRKCARRISKIPILKKEETF